MSIANHIHGLSPSPCYRHLLQRLLQWLPTNWSSYTLTLLQHILYIATWVTFSKAVWCWKHHYKYHHWFPTNHKLKFKIVHVDYEVLHFWPLPTFQASNTSFYLVLCSPTPLTPCLPFLELSNFFLPQGFSTRHSLCMECSSSSPHSHLQPHLQPVFYASAKPSLSPRFLANISQAPVLHIFIETHPSFREFSSVYNYTFISTIICLMSLSRLTESSIRLILDLLLLTTLSKERRSSI